MQPTLNQMTQSPNPQQTQMNRSPTEQGQVQYQNMSYSTTPNTGVPLQRGQPSQMTPQMVQQMYAQNPSMQAEINQQMQAQLQQQGLKNGRILESHNSDKEITQKLKVTKIALKALEGLKKNYGKHYDKHMDDVKQKIKYFSGYVMKGDPIKKLKVLQRKLEKADSIVKHKKRQKHKLKLKTKKSKKKRKLFFKKVGKFFKGLAKAGGDALIQAELKTLLEASPNPSLKTLLSTLQMGPKEKFFKSLGIIDMNKEVLLIGVKGLDLKIKMFLLAKKFNLMKSDFAKILKISPSYEPNLKKLDKSIKEKKKMIEIKEREIAKTKLKVKKAIAKNDREFKMYEKTTKIPIGNAKREKNKDLKKLLSNPNLNVVEFVGKNSIDCGLQVRTFIHTMGNHSPLKEKYCNYVYKNFKKIKIKELRFYTKLAKKEMQSILAMKKSLYCGVCDATLQNNFDDKHKLILYSQRFCHDLISQYKDYIKFRHIILIQFYDQFFQLMSCFEFKNELGVDYPYRTMLETRKRRIKTIKKCLLNLNTPEFYKYCYYVCSQFNIIKFSPFFDGDLDLLKTLYAKFTMFFRRYRVYKRSTRKSKKKRRKRKRQLKIKHQTSMKEAFNTPIVETETGINSESITIDKTKNNKKSPLKKKKSKLSREAHEKMKSLKKHFKTVNTSLTDEISMLVMNHKKKTNKKRKELSNRKKYIKDYHDSYKGKKILSKKHNLKSVKADKIPKASIKIDQKNSQETETTAKVEIDKENSNKNQGLWGRKRILSSDISQTFSNELQNSFFEKRLEEENRKEAELTQSVRLSRQEGNVNDRDLKVNLTGMGGHTDDISEEVEKKIKKPKKKMGFSYAGKKKKSQAQKIRDKISYLRLHTENDRLPTYFNYSINPNLRKTYTETIYSKSIYHKTYLPFKIKTFRPFFVKSIHGFNPLRTTEMMRLDFDPRQIIALTRKKNYKPEKLTGKIVKTYLSFDREDMAGFKHDVDLDFDEYRFTNDKNYTKKSIWPKFKLKNKKLKKPFKRDDSKPFKRQTKREFENPDVVDLHDHFRKTTTNHHHGWMWMKFFGR